LQDDVDGERHDDRRHAEKGNAGTIDRADRGAGEEDQRHGIDERLVSRPWR